MSKFVIKYLQQFKFKSISSSNTFEGMLSVGCILMLNYLYFFKVATFFGSVGMDKYSKILEEQAVADGVNPQYQYNEKEPTGTCAVLITGKHRSLCANLAAANCFTIDHIQKPENRKLIENAQFFYISVLLTN